METELNSELYSLYAKQVDEQSLNVDPGVAALNGYNFLRQMPYLIESIEDYRRYTAPSVLNSTSARLLYPGVSQYLKAFDTTVELADVTAEQRMAEFNTMRLNMQSIDRVEHGMDWTLQKRPIEAGARYDGFVASNLNQFHREHIASRMAALRLDWPRLNQRLDEALDYLNAGMACRPPVTFHHRHHDVIPGMLHSMDSLFIGLVQSLPQRMAAEEILNSFLLSYFDTQLNAESYRYWMQENHSVEIGFSQHPNFKLVLTKCGLPAIHISHNSDSIPIIRHVYGIPLIHDTIYLIEYVKEPNQLMPDEETNRLITQIKNTDLIWLLTAFMGLLSMNTANHKTGRGQQKVSWIHTPLNASNVNIISNLTRHLLGLEV